MYVCRRFHKALKLLHGNENMFQGTISVTDCTIGKAT